MTNPSYKINNYKSIQMTFLIKSQKRLSKINFQIILKFSRMEELLFIGIVLKVLWLLLLLLSVLEDELLRLLQRRLNGADALGDGADHDGVVVAEMKS